MTIDFGLISLGPGLALDLAIHEQMIRLLPFSDVGFENPTVKIRQVQKVALGIPTGPGALDSFESMTCRDPGASVTMYTIGIELLKSDAPQMVALGYPIEDCLYY